MIVGTKWILFQGQSGDSHTSDCLTSSDITNSGKARTLARPRSQIVVLLLVQGNMMET